MRLGNQKRTKQHFSNEMGKNAPFVHSWSVRAGNESKSCLNIRCYTLVFVLKSDFIDLEFGLSIPALVSSAFDLNFVNLDILKKRKHAF